VRRSRTPKRREHVEAASVNAVSAEHVADAGIRHVLRPQDPPDDLHRRGVQVGRFARPRCSRLVNPVRLIYLHLKNLSMQID
jgi:hypothetical protein